jgi:cytochrome P450
MLGHLWRWSRDPVSLLTEGARCGPVFRLALWRPVVVGYRPEWNRAVLGNPDTFRSGGSLSDLTPYLAAGVVHSDGDDHDNRREQLNPHFHARAVAALSESLEKVASRHTPTGPFEALTWSAQLVRRMLNAAFFDDRLPDGLLERFLDPLHRRPPGPLVPRPLLFRRIEAAIADVLYDPPAGSLAVPMSTVDNSVEETRVALAAGYDTTAHTLAWAVWHLAARPEWRRREALAAVVDETLRLYPAGWLGSRITATAARVMNVDLPAGTMVLYSPYLTHRDPDLWTAPTAFDPGRFATAGRPAWGYLPFAAGRRTCLGAGLARLMLHTALEPFCDNPLRRLGGDPTVTSGITLRPAGPLWVDRAA